MDEGLDDTHIAEGDPLLNRVLAGKLELEKILGSGAMGVVYRARHKALDKVVAIKVLRAEGKGDPTRARRFKAEARAASRLDHPNSVQILDFGEDGPDGLLYIAMEFLEGEDLQSALKREGRMSPERTAKIMIQVLGALGAAHEHGVIHRDMKPGNIMLLQRVDDDGERNDFVKVCDFGLAKILDTGLEDVSGAPLTKQGAIFGTPSYMSPEQARGEKLDARSDLYSCGVILYKMLTGESPFVSDTAWGLLMKHMNEAPPPMKGIIPGLPDAVVAIVERAMAKKPEDRFQSAQEMRSALKGFLRSGEVDPTYLRGMSQTGVDLVSAAKRARPELSDSRAPVLASEAKTPIALPAQASEAKTPIALPAQAPASPLQTTIPPASEALAAPRRSMAPVIGGIAVVALLAAGFGLRGLLGGTEPAGEVVPLATAEPSMVPKPTPTLVASMSPTPTPEMPSPPPEMSPAPTMAASPSPSDPGMGHPPKKVHEPRPSVTPTKTPSPSATPSASAAPVATPAPTPTAAASPSPTAAPVATPTPAPTAAPVPGKVLEERPTISVAPKSVEGPHLLVPTKHLVFHAKVSAVKISGGASPRRTQDALERAVTEIQRCLEQGQKALDPSGSFEVSAGVDTRGRLQNVEIRGKLGAAQACLKSAIEAATVPKPDTGEAKLSFAVAYEGS
ncbi:MAG: protein kinase [Myxococcota bacterium]